MANPKFYLQWKIDDVLVNGFSNNSFVNTNNYFNINFPGGKSEVKKIQLSSSGIVNQTYETMRNVRFYLSGQDMFLELIQNIWPNFGSSYTPQRLDLNGGVEISFDNGNSYQRFSRSIGYKDDPTTWLTIPSYATSSKTDGLISAFDVAEFYIRYNIPQQCTDYRLINVNLSVAFDIE